MSDNKGQQEPSMEEILASIRRIISEDGETPPKPVEVEEEASPPPPPPPPSPPSPSPPPPPPPPIEEPEESESDILELTNVVDEDPLPSLDEIADSEPDWGLDDDKDPLADFRDAFADDEPPPPPQTPPPQTPPPQIPPQAQQTPYSDDGIISPEPRDMATAAFQRLANNLGDEIALGSMRISPVPGSRTVEDVIRDLLRPLLREWLDANLPDLVERLVTQEIERMKRRSRDYDF